ncbi:peptidyl-prolyl cis-trans isomerase PpiD [Hydrogenimonas sp.]|nr:peptidyl-prolyl cis-trans isomerase PpiD [Hydrogenimonas sp.]
MKKFIFLFISLTAVYLFASSDTNTTGKNGVVATVNGYNITKAELDRQVGILMPRSFFHSTVTPEKLKEVEKDALKELVKKHLLLQYAKKRGYKIPDSIVEREEKKIKKAFGSQERFEAALKRSNLTYDEFKKELLNDLLMQKLYDKEIKTDLTEEDLKEYYEKNKYKFKVPEKIKVRIIYVRNDPTDPKGHEKALKRAQEALDKIKNGENFADIASKYSNAMSRIKGGDMGFVHKGMLDEPIEKVAYSLKKGEVSDIVETPKGFYIIKLEEISPAVQLDFDQVKENLKKELKSKYENRKLEAILKQMRQSAEIKYN